VYLTFDRIARYLSRGRSAVIAEPGVAESA